MAEDRLFQELKEKLKDDFTPVKPLKEAWKRAFWIIPLSLLFVAATLAVFHPRPDYANFNTLELWGFILLQILASYLVLTISLKTGIPGSARTLLLLTVFGLTGFGIFLIASGVAFHASPGHPATGEELGVGMACMSVIGALGILALLLGFFLVRSGLPFRAGAVGLTLGLGSGLAAEAAWRLHCPFSSWDHILIFHGGAVLILAVIGLAAGYLWRRKTSRR